MDPGINDADLVVEVKHIHRGMGTKVDPLTKVLFFNEHDPKDMVLRPASEPFVNYS